MYVLWLLFCYLPTERVLCLQKLAILMQDQENVVAENGDLQHELNMYKSVAVPLDHRPRTNITRVARPPLISLARSLNTEGVNFVDDAKRSSRKYMNEDGTNQIWLSDTCSGDMTIDEIS